MRSGPHKAIRSEEEVFADLSTLCAKPGYIHALAFICYRDNFVSFEKEMDAQDTMKLFSKERLIRTEITTLLGILVQNEINFEVPDVETVQLYAQETLSLMEELHASIGAGLFEFMKPSGLDDEEKPMAVKGSYLREPIFYGTESAYAFQYRDFAPEKYGKDDEWLRRTRGFDIGTARDVVSAMGRRQNLNVMAAFISVSQDQTGKWTMLPGFYQSAEELAAASGHSLDEVRAVLNAFTLKDNNPAFTNASAFNSISSTPLIPLPDGRVILFQYYSMAESLYESPMYWMGADDDYKVTAFKHRGQFTETFAARRLAGVFGNANVRSNVDVFDGKDKAGEIDVLVTFGDRVIVVQAKSKRLTLEARKGNDGQIQEDFQKAIRASYEQGLLCAEKILNGTGELRDNAGNHVKFIWKPKEIFILNIVSDHYPALSFQVSQYLKYRLAEGIRPPFVMDVFLLDAMTEMLDSPLRLLNYINMRVQLADRLHLAHELVGLSFHLKQNTLPADSNTFIMLDDDVAADLDVAMTARRDSVPGKRTPDGILTRFAGTAFERLIKQIEEKSDPAAVELGFLLLSLNEDTCMSIDQAIGQITRRAKLDGKVHDFTVGVSGTPEGICIHCNPAPDEEARDKLALHCHLRKYSQKARKWIGICLDTDETIRMGVVIDYEWEHSEEMDKQVAAMPSRAVPIKTGKPLIKWEKEKTGRNDPCPCGSGLKYKKCHLLKA
jgi:hypothetical protein